MHFHKLTTDNIIFINEHKNEIKNMDMQCKEIINCT